jgi:MoxR-like ATPase
VVGALLVEGPDGDTRTKMARQVAAVATAPVSVARTGFMTVTQRLILVTTVRVS